LNTREIVRAWGRILAGRTPSLSIEVTRECPLSCPGCYFHDANHLGVGHPSDSLGDYKGDDLVERVMALVERLRPLGGQPNCSECGCMGFAGLQAVGRHRLPVIGLRVGRIYDSSYSFGRWAAGLRQGVGKLLVSGGRRLG